MIWSTGFHRDHRWIEVPVFDGRGYPMHRRGVTSCPGLYFLGLPWQHTWGSGRFGGSAATREYLAERHRRGPRQAPTCAAGSPARPRPAAAVPVG